MSIGHDFLDKPPYSYCHPRTCYNRPIIYKNLNYETETKQKKITTLGLRTSFSYQPCRFD